MQEDIIGIDHAQEKLETGMNWLGKIIAILVILGVAGFGDVMYVKLMQSVLPSGPMLVLCYIGAFTSFLGTVYLLIGKTSLFTPGKQTTFAWLVLGVELLIIALNIVLVFHGEGNDQFLGAWVWVAPATPVINMCFVAVLFFLDEDQIEKHRDKVLISQQKQMDRHYKDTVFQAQLSLKHKQLQYLSSELEKAVNSPQSLAFIQQTAMDMNAGLLSTFAGRSYGTPQPPTIETGQGSGTVNLAQTSDAATSADKEAVAVRSPRPFPGTTNQRRNARWSRKRGKGAK